MRCRPTVASGLLGPLVLLLLLLIATVPASAQQRAVCANGEAPRPDRSTGRYVCADGSTPSVPGPSPAPSPGTPVVQPGTPEVDTTPRTRVRIWRNNPDGTTCTSFQWRPIPEGQTETEVQSLHNRQFFLMHERYMRPDNHSEPCAGEDGGEDVPRPTNDQVWAVLEGHLDRPEPEIMPGRMLTGLTSYLETGRPLEHSNSVSVMGFTLEVRATATFMVDWGDGTVTGPYDTPGAPYPDGTVTHIYTDKGTYDVQVTDTWTMEWRFGGEAWSPAIETEMEPVTLEGFDVREYRAVRVAPDS